MNHETDYSKNRALIESAFDDRNTITPESADDALVSAIEASLWGLEHGELRVAEPSGDGWQVNEWLKKAVLLYFRIRHNEVLDS